MKIEGYHCTQDNNGDGDCAACARYNGTGFMPLCLVRDDEEDERA